MEITCLTKLTAPERGELFDLYDIAELDFVLSEPYDGECFFCAELCEEAAALHRGNVAVSSGRFRIEIGGNLLDRLKCLPAASREAAVFPLRFQLEIDGAPAASGRMELPNPWFTPSAEGEAPSKGNPAAAIVKGVAGDLAGSLKQEVKRDLKVQVKKGKKQLTNLIASSIRNLIQS